MNNPLKFKHFLITLFNLKLWGEDKVQQTTRSAEWLRQRFSIFEKYCMPSVINQTNKNFIWLCLFDKDTPFEYRSRIVSYVKMIPQMHPCFFTANESKQFFSNNEAERCLFVRRVVIEMLSPDDQFVITSNLDNDDALHKEYIERVQKQFIIDQKYSLISFIYGKQYFVNLNAIVSMRYPHNHFLTLVETTGNNIRTVEFYGHASARKVLPNIDIGEKSYWMEIVHSRNVSNDLRITSRVGYSPCLRAEDLSDYGIEKKFSLGINIWNFVFKLPVYFIKIAVWRIRRKWRKRKLSRYSI